ncbi:hypothetical protein TrLO_g14019 [Triparma laevis f. longispina]|uniref:Uncharacterized protein n=1 Tax=Triparma laevis f. longispina TaxID=1714387 RepID=A0A9W6ZE84_9STRA|nr:hypothetical protein TrLO_g14019 [Triparma laevis f. longispina]
MSKSVATRRSSRLKAQKNIIKRGGEDEEKEDGEEQNEGSAADDSLRQQFLLLLRCPISSRTLLSSFRSD